MNKDKNSVVPETLLVVPFAGSGSECVSAKNNNVNFIGFEINNDYITIANERLV
jgi:DNA modification methylase